MLGLGDIYQARERAAEASYGQWLAEADADDLVAAGICPECRGEGCETCDETGHVWRCFECERLVPGERGASTCCQSCNDGEPEHTTTGCGAADAIEMILEKERLSC